MYSNINFRIILLGMIIGTLFPSCVHHKEMITLNRADRPTNIPSDVKSLGFDQLHKYKAYEIQAFDQLMIKINAFDGRTEEFLNREFTAENTFSRELNYDPASLYFNSYTVNEKGTIVLPLIGEVSVKSKTISEIKKDLDEAYKPHLKLVATAVKLANMRVTVFGEVNDPGVHYLNNERNTILDVISMAGDITDFGNREKVKLIRQDKHGIETVYLDMSTSGFMSSEYYYVQPYDVIYIEPNKFKAKDRSSKVTGVVISAVSVAALIISLFTR